MLLALEEIVVNILRVKEGFPRAGADARDRKIPKLNVKVYVPNAVPDKRSDLSNFEF